MFPQPEPPYPHRTADRALLRAVPSTTRVILDVGCGAGLHGELLKREVPGRLVFGVEPDPAAAAEAGGRLDRVFVADVADVAAGELPLAPGSLDCLLYGDILRTLGNPEAVLARHRRLLRPGGLAVCSVPNVLYHEVLADLLRCDFRYAPAGGLHPGNPRLFTRASFAKLLLDAGFVPDMVEAVPGPTRLDPRFLAALGPALEAVGTHAERAAHNLGASRYVFRAFPLPDPPAAAEPVTVVCCVSDEAVLRANLLASPDLAPGGPHEVFLARGCPSAADGLNAGLERACNPLVVAVHQDVYLPRGWFARAAHEFRRAEHVFGPVGVAGVYGVTGGQPRRVGRVVDPRGLLWEPTPLPAAVSTLDELALLTDRRSGLRFDPALGFHLYAADMCLAARRAGLAAVVLDALCFHNTQTITLPESFLASAAAFARKWPAELPLHNPSARIAPGGGVSLW